MFPSWAVSERRRESADGNGYPPLPPQVVEKWHVDGILVNDKKAKELLVARQPSRNDIAQELKALQKDIRVAMNHKAYEAGRRLIEDGETLGEPLKRMYENQKKLLDEYLKVEALIGSFRASDKPVLGQVFVASGYRIKKRDLDIQTIDKWIGR